MGLYVAGSGSGWNRYISGLWYGPSCTGTDISRPNAFLCAVPLILDRPLTIQNIATHVVSAGSAGSIMRMGIYADNGNGYPSTLLGDAGGADTSTTGFKSLPLALTLSPGLNWLAGCVQNAPTAPTVHGITPGTTVNGSAHNAANPINCGCGWVINYSGTIQPLPATFPYNIGGGGTDTNLNFAVQAA